MFLFVCNEAVECKLVKLETSRTVILPPTVSVLCIGPIALSVTLVASLVEPQGMSFK